MYFWVWCERNRDRVTEKGVKKTKQRKKAKTIDVSERDSRQQQKTNGSNVKPTIGFAKHTPNIGTPCDTQKKRPHEPGSGR